MDRLPPTGGPARAANPLLKQALKGAHGGHAIPPVALQLETDHTLGTLGEEEEYNDDAPAADSKGARAAQGSAAPAGPNTISAGVFATPKARASVAQPSWDTYWDHKTQLELPERGGTFTVYTAGASGPVVLCVHGGGYTGLTWSLMAHKLKDTYRVVAPDMRGHGETHTTNDADLSKETLSEDIVAIWEAMFGTPEAQQREMQLQQQQQQQGQQQLPHVVPPGPSISASPGAAAAQAPGLAVPQPSPGPFQPYPAVMLVGHSMGGGLAVWAAASKRIRRLEGVMVIDVVEGTALAALPHMVNVLSGRPTSFAAPEEAVAWALRSGMARSKEAAAVSLPSQLVAQGQQGQQGQRWVWRTPLAESRPYWEGWYSGLSEAFLQLSCPKALLLAGTDRLDRALTIGQMQGKFQLILMPTAGHAIHEDEADKAAEHVAAFLKRFRVGQPPLTFPRAPPGTRPVLPVVAGPLMPGPGGAGAANST